MTLMTNVVKLVDTITKGLEFQTTATLESFVGDQGRADSLPSPKKKYSVVVDRKMRQVSTGNGLFVTSNATVLFFGAVDVKALDVITLEDGTGGVVVGVSSPTDKSGRLITEAYLG